MFLSRAIDAVKVQSYRAASVAFMSVMTVASRMRMVTQFASIVLYSEVG
jgi:hypothetical protein